MFRTITPASSPILTQAKRTIIFCSLLYALCNSLYTNGTIPYQPAALFDWGATSWIGYLLKTWALSFIIPYPTISWSMAWTFITLGIIFAPIPSFVCSYCGSRAFIKMWFGYSYISGAALMIASLFCAKPADPFSIFICSSYGITIFWILMLRTSRSNPSAFLFIPISTEWIFIAASFICIISPMSQLGVATAIASAACGIAAYFHAISAWKMTAHIELLTSTEENVRAAHYTFEKWFQWNVMRIIRTYLYPIFYRKK